jgi:signal transduction histidine kinase
MPSEVSVTSADHDREPTVEELKRELAGAREEQAATSDILRIISGSAAGAQPAFDAIVTSCRQLLGCRAVAITLLVGRELNIVAFTRLNAEADAELQAYYPLPLDGGSLMSVAAREQIPILIDDTETDTRVTTIARDVARRRDFRSFVIVPMLHQDKTVGTINVAHPRPNAFSKNDVRLLQTFADQAVIAIENTRLFEAEQASRRELQESLEYQTAISNVLGVISRSPNELQLVLDAIVETAARLCQADRGAIWRLIDGKFQFGAACAHSAEVIDFVRNNPPPTGPTSMTGRTVIEKQTLVVEDRQKDFVHPANELARKMGSRSMLSVPLIREDEPLGVIALVRDKVQPFTARQIGLVEAFAAQAVIAIENARLFAEVQARTRDLARTIEDLEIASQHKSQFVANMSHELRTPLAAMLGYAELLQEGIYGSLPEKSLPILMRVHSNGKHLLGLINTVLDISKIEAGQFKLNLAEYALGSIVETVMVATESLAATKKLAFKTEVAKGLPYGLGDEQRLTQVLLNLVGNAIKFTETGEVRIAAGAANGHFTVSVSDTGPGIPAEECERIFEKFRQVDSSNTRAKGGTGLGLAIAREIVEMHGGRIWVESTLGHGSTFRMELPVRAGAGAA